MEKTVKQVKVKQRIIIDVETLMFQLWDIKGTTFAQMKTRTEPKMRKTNNPYYSRRIHPCDASQAMACGTFTQMAGIT